VGEQICTKIDSSPPVDAVVTLECINVNEAITDEEIDQTETEAEVTTKGSSIKIESKYSGDFSLCDITIVAKETE
jgi:hypothetical protein